MILTKTPLRISFVGGGSDLPAFCQESPGAVVSMTISKFIYIAVNKKFDDRIRMSYSITEDVGHVSELKHDLVRNSLGDFGNVSGIEIASIADIPGKGTGLGSSSSFTVGLMSALNVHHRRKVTKERLASLAAYTEMILCNKPIGTQDHYAAAFGGLNLITFESSGEVNVFPSNIDLKTLILLNSRLMLFYTGRSRASKDILEDQQDGLFASESKRETTKEMAKLAHRMATDLNKNDLSLFGDYLAENWLLKTELSDKISDTRIDTWMEAGLDAGAIGGKIAGAGGGGFILFYAPIRKQPEVRSVMTSLGLKEMEFYFHPHGSEVVYNG